MAHKSEKYNGVKKLYDNGLSIKGIADIHGVSRQAMHDVLKRRGVEFRVNLRFGIKNHFWRGSSACDRSQNIVEKAILRGDIVPPDRCTGCGLGYRFKDGRRAIQAHHCDYNKPLDVVWLCQKCHHKWHKENKATAWRQ